MGPQPDLDKTIGYGRKFDSHPFHQPPGCLWRQITDPRQLGPSRERPVSVVGRTTNSSRRNRAGAQFSLASCSARPNIHEQRLTITDSRASGGIFMLCTNCGEDVPMAGNVCPWCGHSKAADRSWTMASYVAVGAAVAGYFIAGFPGAIGGFAAGWAGYMFLTRAGGAKSPSTSAQASPPSVSSEPVADKLAQLKQMHDQGLISADEFARKKAELLSRI